MFQASRGGSVSGSAPVPPSQKLSSGSDLVRWSDASALNYMFAQGGTVAISCLLSYPVSCTVSSLINQQSFNCWLKVHIDLIRVSHLACMLELVRGCDQACWFHLHTAFITGHVAGVIPAVSYKLHTGLPVMALSDPEAKERNISSPHAWCPINHLLHVTHFCLGRKVERHTCFEQQHSNSIGKLGEGERV